VFASFGFSGERIVSAIGIGMALAVVVDAFVVRLTLIPALMTLVGRYNWSYPRWADRLTPQLSIEGTLERPQLTPVPAVTTALPDGETGGTDELVTSGARSATIEE